MAFTRVKTIPLGFLASNFVLVALSKLGTPIKNPVTANAVTGFCVGVLGFELLSFRLVHTCIIISALSVYYMAIPILLPISYLCLKGKNKGKLFADTPSA